MTAPSPMSADQRAVMAHAVVDPDAWLTHAVAEFGADAAAAMLAAKVARLTPGYLAALAAEGPQYKTRAEREALLP